MTTVEPAGVSERPSAPCRSCGNVHLIGAVHDFMGSPKMCIHDHNLIVDKLRQQLAETKATGNESFRLAVFHQERADKAEQQLAEMRGALEAQQAAEDFHANCEDCNEHPTRDWACCAPCSERFGKAIDMRSAVLTSSGHSKTCDTNSRLIAFPLCTCGFDAAPAPTSQPGKCERSKTPMDDLALIRARDAEFDGNDHPGCQVNRDRRELIRRLDALKCDCGHAKRADMPRCLNCMKEVKRWLRAVFGRGLPAPHSTCVVHNWSRHAWRKL